MWRLLAIGASLLFIAYKSDGYKKIFLRYEKTIRGATTSWNIQ